MSEENLVPFGNLPKFDHATELQNWFSAFVSTTNECDYAMLFVFPERTDEITG